MAPAASTDEIDALWKLAPDDAIVGVVMSPRAVGMIEHAWQDVHAYMAATPELAAIDRMLRDEIQDRVGAPVTSLADVGLAPAHGAALFVTRAGASIAIVPVADRDKFLATVHGTRGATVDTLAHGTCAPLHDYYACASDAELFKKLGGGSAGAGVLRAKLNAIGARGDIEAVAAALPIQPSAPVDLAGVVQLDRGAVTLRFAALGISTITTASLGAPAPVRSDGNRSAGFAVANVSRLVAQMPPSPVLPGLTLADLAHSVADPLTIAIATGPLVFDLRLPLSDPAPMTQAIAHCHDFAVLAQMGATIDGDVCHIPIQGTGIAVDAWVEGSELRIGKRLGTPAPVEVPLTPIGHELAAGSWQLAVWGRGTMFAPLTTTAPAAMLPDQIKLMLRGLSLLDEVGVGVYIDGTTVTGVVSLRTLWSNPDDVVAKLTALTPDDIVSGRASTAAKTIADGTPNAPFAADYASGYGGLMAPAAVSGVLAGVAIPAFTRYMERSRAAAPATPPTTP